jgi:hypothetical protein
MAVTRDNIARIAVLLLTQDYDNAIFQRKLFMVAKRWYPLFLRIGGNHIIFYNTSSFLPDKLHCLCCQSGNRDCF